MVYICFNVLMLLKSYLFLVHLLLDRKFSMLYFLPWQKNNQMRPTVKSKVNTCYSKYYYFYVDLRCAASFEHATA